MTDRRCPDEITPVRPGTDLQATPDEQSRRQLSEEIIELPTESIRPESEPGTKTHTSIEQKDVVEKVARGSDRQDGQPDEKIEDAAANVRPGHKMDDKPYSVFTHNEKRIIVVCAGLCAFFSPISGQIYFPSLDTIATDLHVSYTMVSLTITTYLIMQGLAPAFVGGFSDSSGRRPAYFICFLIYIGANIGLGVQNNYAALMVLRCLQSAGGSGTVALANAVVSDIVTSQERGVYVSYLSVAPQAGPSLGPIIGGLLGQYLGWHSVFWFLLICAGVVFVAVALFLPETCRKVVDDGSVPPPRWSRAYINTKIEKRLLTEGRLVPYDKRDELARKRKLRFPNPLETVKIVFTKEAGFALGYIGIIALCYLPLGCGSMLAAFVRGKIIDSRYRVHAKRSGMPLDFNRRVDLSNFPIERARLEVAIPTLTLGSACMIGFGWMVEYKVNLAGPLIFLFFIGFCISASVNTVSVLLVDIYPGRAGTATAANNLVRCWLGAGATSGVVPLIDKIGIGWTSTFFGLLVIVFSPVLWYIMKNGPEWRRATKERKQKQEAKRAAEADVGYEKGQ
ncbi:MAG: hypothetical protein Q9165_002814 [Trypethelium subeluteriae]